MAKMKKAADGYTNYGSKASTPSPVTDYAGKPGKQDSYTQYKKGGVIKKKAQSGTMTKKTVVDTTKKGLSGNPLFKKASEIKDTTTYKKAKNGSSFGMLSVKAGIDKNPNPTQADRIAGAKGMAKKGAMIKKIGKAAKQAATAIAMKKAGKAPKKMMKSGGTVSMQLGSYTRTIGKNYSGKAKMGKSMGKCKYGC